MSFGSSSSSTLTVGSLSATNSEKLNGDNFLLWRAQIVLDVCGAHLYGYLDGLVAAPDKQLKTKDKDAIEVSVPNPNHGKCIS
jgi:hypothetical protein